MAEYIQIKEAVIFTRYIEAINIKPEITADNIEVQRVIVKTASGARHVALETRFVEEAKAMRDELVQTIVAPDIT